MYKRQPSRRTVLASIATTAAVATGGFESDPSGVTAPSLESGIVPADRHDCSDVERPEPDRTDSADTLESLPYPAPPSKANAGGDRSPAAGSRSSAVYGVSRYVTEFERAYRRNAFLARYGSLARTVTLHRTAYRTAPIDPAGTGDAVLVAIRYNLTKGTRQSFADQRTEWDVRVVYYFDERILLRARYNGVAEELSFDPDPRTHGTLVACVD
ncbi:hypothetical protein C487_06503 [Natrinema pallidum DSM 3751]|uniref:Uncharacterized protein n=1 Tax=Natrinema pallidum DSM 3751 TaxID=1227495 RepID=L9Z2D9_9EURY|nr:hypothetical protein C487_06503 [Natrinema pallidum DSM 3751]